MHEVIFIESNTENNRNDSDWGIEFENDEDRERFETLKQKYDENVRGAKKVVGFKREIRNQMINYLSEKELDYKTASKIMDWKIHNLYTWNYNNGGNFKAAPRYTKEKKPYPKTEREVILVCKLIKAAESKMVDSDYDGKVKNLRKLLDPGTTEKKN